MATAHPTPSRTGRAAHLRLVPTDGRAFKRPRKPRKRRWPHGLDPERLVREAAEMRLRADDLTQITSASYDEAIRSRSIVGVAIARETAMHGKWCGQSMRLAADTLEAVAAMLVEAETAAVGQTG